MQLFEAEVPGPTLDRLVRIQDTARVLWGVYVIFTAAEALLLWGGGMSLFESVCHALTTMATGGFSTRNIVAAYGTYTHMIVLVFMFLAGVNASLHYHALRGHVRRYWSSEEFRFYLAIIVTATLVITLLLAQDPRRPRESGDQAPRRGVPDRLAADHHGLRHRRFRAYGPPWPSTFCSR